MFGTQLDRRFDPSTLGIKKFIEISSFDGTMCVVDFLDWLIDLDS